MNYLLVFALIFFGHLSTCVFAQEGSGAAQRGDSDNRSSSSSSGSGSAEKLSRSPNTAPGGQLVVVAAPGGSANGAAAAAATPCGGVATAGTELAVVIKGRANLRERANISGAVVNDVKKGSVLVVEAHDGPGSPWYKVTEVLSGKAGWIHGDAIRIAYKK